MHDQLQVTPHPFNVLVRCEGDIARVPGFAVTFRSGDGEKAQEVTWLLTREEGAQLAVSLSGVLIGQAVSR
jgi:hypothetical protein